jgi:hypothetical protein
MKKSKVIINFATLSDANLEARALSIADKMTGNPAFPNPSPTLAELTAAATEYSDALSMAQNKDKVQIAIKNIKREALENVLGSLGGYVSFTANGDRSIIVGAGFEANKDTTGAQPMPDPKNFTVVSGRNPGEATTSVSGVKGVKTYAHQYTPDPLTVTSMWQSKYVTSRTHTFEGLMPGTKIWFRVAALGSGDQMAYTDPISMIIQ